MALFFSLNQHIKNRKKKEKKKRLALRKKMYCGENLDLMQQGF